MTKQVLLSILALVSKVGLQTARDEEEQKFWVETVQDISAIVEKDMEANRNGRNV